MQSPLRPRESAGPAQQEVAKRAEGPEFVVRGPSRRRPTRGLGDLHLKLAAEVVGEHGREREDLVGGAERPRDQGIVGVVVAVAQAAEAEQDVGDQLHDHVASTTR